MQGLDLYVQKRTEEALSTDYYDPLGNSDLATYNKTFIQLFMYSAKRLTVDIKQVARQPAQDVTLGELLGLVIVIPLFPVFSLLRAYHSKKRAVNELRAEWQR